MARDLILLKESQPGEIMMFIAFVRTSSSAIRFWMSKAILESRYLTSFSSTKFFFDCDEIFDLRSRRIFWAMRRVSRLSGSDFNARVAYLSPGHLQSPDPSRSRTWTGTRSSWNIALTGGLTSLHRRTTLCSGVTLVGRKRTRPTTPSTGSAA